MRVAAIIAVLAGLTAGSGAAAQEIFSAYTDIDIDKNCSAFARADSGGDAATFICAGYRGYPVILHYSDLRESIFYGFPKVSDEPPVWESFGSFNSTGPKVEWRIVRQDDIENPFATIHRWYVQDPMMETRQIEVLVVEKVGQLMDGEGCTVGYVVATGNPNANEKARQMADGQARRFKCGDAPLVDAGTVPLPDVVRWGADDGVE